MNPQKVDRIRVLLIDDEPEHLQGDWKVNNKRIRGTQLPGFRSPDSTSGSKEDRDSANVIINSFELRWVASVREARIFRDLSRQVQFRTPEQYRRCGWFPEIVVFDYAMSGNEKTVLERLDKAKLPLELAEELSPLPSLKRLVGEDYEDIIGKCPQPPSTGQTLRQDNMGLYCGGLISTLFGNHPSVPVALTRKGSNKTVGTPAAFFEWFIEKESGGTFQRKGKPLPSWLELLGEGAFALRVRIRELVIAGLIRVSLHDLLELSENGTSPTIIHIDGGLSRRGLPLAGLFLDCLHSEQAIEAQKWATSILDALWAKQSLSYEIPNDTLNSTGDKANIEPLPTLSPARELLSEAIDAANVLLLGYESPDFENRIELSLLLSIGKENLEEEHRERLKNLSDYFGVPKQLKTRSRLLKHFCDIRTFRESDGGDSVVRWAALFILVRLEMFRSKALLNWQTRRGEEPLHYLEMMLFPPVRVEEWYDAIFPIPFAPIILPAHSVRDHSATWGPPLRRLHDPNLHRRSLRTNKDNNWGNLALSLTDVLIKRRRWFEDSKVNQNEWSYGLLPGEHGLLQMYAEGLGFEKAYWPEWLLQEPSLPPVTVAK